MSRILRYVVMVAVVALVAVSIAGVISFSTDAEARGGPCRCPQIYAPVECDNGKTYPNQCVADCKKAKNCVPTGVL